MDWFFDSSDLHAFRALRAEFADYLRRHADADSDVDGAEVVFSEVLTNAMQHAGGPVWVSLEWSEECPTLTVHDLGPGFDLNQVRAPAPDALNGRGLLIVSHLTEQLQVAQKGAGGARVSTVLPVHRSTRPRRAPSREAHGALPSPEEASDAGAFGKESFLRALVVQLAQAVDQRHGPEAAEAAIAQVGTDVGGRMEEEYRRVRELTDRLTPEQMADLYVRLKGAIGGDFYVIEADERRIVLGNRRCPFGDVVKRAPALCRMTSSVFGGIGARNTGASAVHLEERIAVGDPGCRVVVWLGEAAAEAPRAVHVYSPGRVGDANGAVTGEADTLSNRANGTATSGANGARPTRPGEGRDPTAGEARASR